MQHLSKTDSQSVLALRKDFYAMCERENIGLIAKCLVQIFQAEKINYAIWGDKVNHTHIHLVPKAHELPQWGSPFLHDPDHPIHVDEQLFQTRVMTLRKALK